MGQLSVRSTGAVVLTAALALLLAITLAPTTVSAQEIQRAPDEEHDDHKLGRYGVGNLDEHYADSFGVQEVGHWESLGFNADVWGHGRYAYVGSWGSLANPPETCPSQGVRVIDLIDPRNPRHVATLADAETYPQLEGSWTEKVVVADVASEDFSGTMAAVSVQNCEPDGARGWSIWDVTIPEDPILLHFEETEPEVETRAGSHEIFLESRDDGSAYVYTAEIQREVRQSDPEQDEFEPDLQIWDVSDPDNPDNVGSWGVWQDEGIHPLGPDDDGIDRTRFVHSVIVSDGVAYVSYWDRGTVLLDVSDPSDPSMVSSVDVPTEDRWSRGSAHSAWLADGGNLLIETPEVFNPNPDAGSDQETAFGYPRFTDISDPTDPEILGYFEMPSTRLDPAEDLPPGDWTVHDPKVRPGLPGTDDTAYFSWYSEGVVVTDISDPADVDQTAQFVPPAHPDPFGVFQPSDVEFPFVWGVYLMDDIAGRGPYALASDINSGLWVFRLDEEVPEGLCDDLDLADFFDDVSEANTHLIGISCVVQAAIAVGTSLEPPLFSPTRPVTRAQLATFVAQTLDAAGYDLPEAGDQVFADVAPGHTHYDNINRLARAEIVRGVTVDTFAPNLPVNRGQTATFLIQALEHALDVDIDPAGDVPFADATGTTHEANIASAAELGLVLGFEDGAYRPFGATRRDQMATVVTRLLGSLEFTLFPGVEDPDDDDDPDPGPPED